VALERAGDEEDVRLRRRRRDAFLPEAHGVATGGGIRVFARWMQDRASVFETLVHSLDSWMDLIYRADS
jgi:hypothetical protein